MVRGCAAAFPQSSSVNASFPAAITPVRPLPVQKISPDRHNVRDVMLAVPRIVSEVLLEANGATLRMMEGAKKIRLAHGFEQPHPTAVKPLQQAQGGLDGHAGTVRKIGPEPFIVRFDNGRLLGKRQLEPHVGVHVAIGQMMDHLPSSPAARPVRCVELLLAQTRHGRAQERGGFGNVTNPLASLLRCGRLGKRELPDRITRVWAHRESPGLCIEAGTTSNKFLATKVIPGGCRIRATVLCASPVSCQRAEWWTGDARSPGTCALRPTALAPRGP